MTYFWLLNRQCRELTDDYRVDVVALTFAPEFDPILGMMQPLLSGLIVIDLEDGRSRVRRIRRNPANLSGDDALTILMQIDKQIEELDDGEWGAARPIDLEGWLTFLFGKQHGPNLARKLERVAFER
jgi:hypothetical protein